MLVFTLREPGAFYSWRTAFLIYVCLTDMINVSATPLVPSSAVYPVCKQFLSCVLREPRISSLVFFLGARSAVVVGFQYSLPPFSSVFDSCLPVFISIIFTFSCTLSVHLLRGRAYLLVPLWLLQFVLVFFGFAVFQHDHTIVVGRIL
jgi:hypothetical protein